jgi:drug/metabolite transporter (DMT)-like permease
MRAQAPGVRRFDPQSDPPGAPPGLLSVRHAHVPTSAVLLIVGSVLCFTLLDTTMKFLTRSYPVGILVWARYMVQVVALIAWLAPTMRLEVLRTSRARLHALRGILVLASSVMFVTALSLLPLADATAVNYSTPVLVILLAVAFLGERMTPSRIAFVVAGIVGMLLIVRPGSDLFQGGSLYAVAAAFCYAIYQILTRLMASEDPRLLLFYPALLGVVLMSAIAPTLDWPAAMPWPHVALIVVGGLLGTMGHFLFILAFRHAPASALTPFTYMQLVWATLLGWLVYGEFPDALTLAGMAVIAGSGLLITLHERRRRRIPDPITVE